MAKFCQEGIQNVHMANNVSRSSQSEWMRPLQHPLGKDQSGFGLGIYCTAFPFPQIHNIKGWQTQMM